MCVFFFFKQKTAYEMRISDWSSDVCSSDLARYTTYKIGADQLQWLGEQAQELARVTEIVCCEHIAALERRVAGSGAQHRSEERRVGKACVLTCSSRWSPNHSQKKDKSQLDYSTNSKSKILVTTRRNE